MSPQSKDIGGRTILIVEDEYLIAVDMARQIRRCGGSVVGPVRGVQAAIDLLASGEALDGAILDVNLNGEPSYEVADELAARGVPFVFVTGYDESALPVRFASRPRHTKPMRLEAVAREMFGSASPQVAGQER